MHGSSACIGRFKNEKILTKTVFIMATNVKDVAAEVKRKAANYNPMRKEGPIAKAIE